MWQEDNRLPTRFRQACGSRHGKPFALLAFEPSTAARWAGNAPPGSDWQDFCVSTTNEKWIAEGNEIDRAMTIVIVILAWTALSLLGWSLLRVAAQADRNASVQSMRPWAHDAIDSRRSPRTHRDAARCAERGGGARMSDVARAPVTEQPLSDREARTAAR